MAFILHTQEHQKPTWVVLSYVKVGHVYRSLVRSCSLMMQVLHLFYPMSLKRPSVANLILADCPVYGIICQLLSENVQSRLDWFFPLLWSGKAK